MKDILIFCPSIEYGGVEKIYLLLQIIYQKNWKKKSLCYINK